MSCVNVWTIKRVAVGGVMKKIPLGKVSEENNPKHTICVVLKLYVHLYVEEKKFGSQHAKLFFFICFHKWVSFCIGSSGVCCTENVR